MQKGYFGIQGRQHRINNASNSVSVKKFLKILDDILCNAVM